MITLLDRFTYVAAGSQGMDFPWVSFPDHYKQCDVWIEVHTIETGAITVDIDSSIDTTQQVEAMAGVSLSAVGTTVTNLPDELGPLIRVQLSSAAATRGVISVWVMPKQA